MPLVSRTRATLRSAEFGFFGVCVNTRTHTPRFCGLFCSAGLFVLVRTLSRPRRTSWLIVGTFTPGALPRVLHARMKHQCINARKHSHGPSRRGGHAVHPPQQAFGLFAPGLGKPPERPGTWS